jgi:hypothetical protein
MVSFAMFSRGHLHDTSTPTTINTGGALDFFRDVLKKEPADVSALFELWAVNREQGASCVLTAHFFFFRSNAFAAGTKGPNTLRSMQKECTEMIQNGLSTSRGSGLLSRYANIELLQWR